MWKFWNKKKIWQEDYESVEDLLKLLYKHRYWGQIDKKTLQKIFNVLFENSKELPVQHIDSDYSGKVFSSEMQWIQDFLILTEEYDVVKNNFIKIAKDPSADFGPLGLMTMFAITLERLGAALAQGYPHNNLSEPELKYIMAMAESSYKSSILCDKYLLPSYYGAIFCCSVFMDLDMAKEWRDMFYKSIEEMNNEEDSNLNDYQIVLRDDKNSIEEMSARIDELYSSFSN
jgi:hypothetical protein